MTLIGLMVIAGLALVVIGLTGLLLVGLEEEDSLSPALRASSPGEGASRGGIVEIPNDQEERGEIT